MKTKNLIVMLAVVALAACGDKNNENSNTDGGPNNNTADTAGPNNNDGDTGGPNNNTPDTGGPNNNTPDTGGPNNNTPDMGGGDDMAGTPDMAADMGGGDQHLEAHSCTFATATDMTGAATVNITDVSTWAIGHAACIIVTTGTVVTWDGNFTQHPLDGGVSPTADAANPIDIAGTGVTGNANVDVTFAAAGDFAYFCGIHTTSMQGVVYVVD